jgi:hypothetical protein
VTSINWNLRLSPTHRIINVGWGSGFYVEVTVGADYRSGGNGSRSANIELTAFGKKAGGKIIGQRSFEIAPIPTFTNGAFSFRAVLRFNRGLTEKELGAAFNLNLGGSSHFTDPNQEDFTPSYFCGTSTSSGTVSYSFAPNPVNGFLEAHVTFTMTTSTPAGSDTVSITYIQGVLDVNDLPKGGALASGSDDEIWYEDKYGSLVNTHLSCDLLPLGGGGTPPSPTRLEGFHSINVNTWPASAYSVVKPSEWVVDAPIMVPKNPDANDNPKNKFWVISIGRIRAGVNNDFEPYYDDIGDGQYGFRVQTMVFTALPKQGTPPKQTDWKQPGVYPTTANYAGMFYSFRTGAGNQGYDPIPHTLDPDDGHDTGEMLIPSGVPPSSGQAFDPL